MKKFDQYSSKNSRWIAVVQRDQQSDGAFYYGVVTTGIYCRSICSSRLPNRENVKFFDTANLAEEAGFRPCKRCTPQKKRAPNTALEAVHRACQMIEESEVEPTLNQLAEAVGLSPYHFHRLFKKMVGITPKQYAIAHRQDRMRKNLQKNSTVTRAMYESGYASSSRFYENATSSLGMKPTEFQSGGTGKVIRYGIVDSYLGWVLVAVSEIGVCRIDLDDSPDNLKTRMEENFPNAQIIHDDPTITTLISQTIDFLETPMQGYVLPLDIQGTAFQQKVWQALQEIPPGTTVSYGEIAQHIDNPKAARAVAQACGSNQIAVAIPCHRVIRKNGDLGGYRWGLDRKKMILEREGNRKGNNPSSDG
jgi:AraC family transcriptional regulator of adaptative response/methylated-DNA-[protein]-cysteine methyltransferase